MVENGARGASIFLHTSRQNSIGLLPTFVQLTNHLLLMLAPASRLYFNNPVGRVMEHPEGYAHVIYEPGTRRLDYLQAFLTHTGQLLRLRGWHRIFGDQRLMTPYTPEESQWIVDYWLTAEQRGSATIYGAVLLSEDAFAQLPASQVMTEAKASALTYRLFDSEVAAQEWLRQVP